MSIGLPRLDLLPPLNDYYWGDKNVSFPLGHIQTAGGVLQDALFAESPPVLSLVTKLIPPPVWSAWPPVRWPGGHD